MTASKQTLPRPFAAWRAAFWAVACAGGVGCSFFQVGEDEVRCHLVTQQPCAATEACVGIGAPHCEKAGTAAIDAPCTLDGDCVREAICSGTGSKRRCLARCDQKAPSCKAPLTCIQATDFAHSDQLGVCTTPDCEPLANTGCPSGERCIGGPQPYCTAVIGVGGDGATCEISESCKASHLCVLPAGESASTCIPLCNLYNPEGTGPGQAGCAPGFSCKALVDTLGHALPAGQGSCTFEFCNALTNFGCKDAEKCYPLQPQVCSYPGNGGLGDPCEKAADCGRDLICVLGGDGMRNCRKVCDFTGKNPNYACGEGQECAQINTGAGKPPLPDGIGICRPKS